MRYLFICTLLSAILAVSEEFPVTNPHQFALPPTLPSGFKVGEVTSTSAVIWTRAVPATRASDIAESSRAGQIRVVYASDDGADTRHTAWSSAHAKNQYIINFTLRKLRPYSRYLVEIQTRSTPHDRISSFSGHFSTPPSAFGHRDLRFAVLGQQAALLCEDLKRGFRTHHALATQQYDFVIQAGRPVDYEDADFVVRDLAAAQQLWARTHNFKRAVELYRYTPSYWLRDDVSSRRARYGSFDFEDALSLFDKQIPHGGDFRTVSYGRHAQIWFLDSRKFSNPRLHELLGHEQKVWLEKSLVASQSTFKFIACPTPIIGPDARLLRDSHANGYLAEGKWLRGVLSQTPNVIILTGNRLWQYTSHDSATGLWEFGAGPVTEAAAVSPSATESVLSKYAARSGGYLAVSVTEDKDGPRCLIRHLATDGSLNFQQALFAR